MLLAILCAALAAAIVALVVLVALCGWAGRVGRAQRIGLCLIAAGVVWAGPDRLAGRPPGLGDLLMLAGILVYGGAVYGRQLRDHLDALDRRGLANVVELAARDARRWSRRIRPF